MRALPESSRSIPIPAQRLPGSCPHADGHAASWRRSVVVGVGALIAVAALGAFTLPSAAAAVTAGTAVITAGGESTPLNSGGSATLYGVQLPSGASCPGDTAHDGYLVYSYLVPAGVSPTVVSFKTGDPSKYYGYISEGSYYGAVNTAENTGEIVEIPPQFTWSRLTPADLFPPGAHTATWDGGIACADTHGVVTNYWNSEIVFDGQRQGPRGLHLEGRPPGPVIEQPRAVGGCDTPRVGRDPRRGRTRLPSA